MATVAIQLRCVAMLTSAALIAVTTLAQSPNADIYGRWKITEMINICAVASLSQEQARKLVGEPLVINTERFECNGKVCSRSQFKRTSEKPTAYFSREWKTGVEGIPFPNPVTIIKTRGCDYLYPIRKDQLMIAERGIFFEAVRLQE